MNKNKNKLKTLNILFMILILTIFSGCEGGSFNLPGFSGSSGKTPTGEVEQVGKGLEVDFQLINTKRINEGQIEYKLSMKNTGLKNIQIDDKNFNFYTVERKNDGSSVFVQKDITELKNNFLDKQTSLLVSNGYSKKFNGVLNIDTEYFKNINKKEINYMIELKYPYETEFANNLEVDLSNFEKPLTVTNKLSQAAPIIINKIDLFKLQDGYSINYYIVRNDDQKTVIELTDFSFLFSNLNLDNCKFHKLQKNKNNNYEKSENAVFDLQTEIIRYSCFIDNNKMNDYQTKTSVQTSGKFKYDYKIKIQNKIQLPDKRGEVLQSFNDI